MADKYLYNNAGTLTERTAVITSAGAGDSGKIIALDVSGKLAMNMMPTGIGAEIQAIVVVTDTLVAGDFVNITGTGVRKADASTNRPAHGFVLAGYSPAQTADVYSISQNNTSVTGMTMGAKQYLGANGAVTATVPSTTGHCLQVIGVAGSATTLMFNPSEPIVLA